MTRSQTVATEVAALLRARNPLLWVVTKEEPRVESYLFEAAASAKYTVRFWDAGQGVTDIAGKPWIDGSTDPGQMLGIIQGRAQRNDERCVWVMRDLPGWLTGPIGMTTLRQVRNVARLMPTLDNAGTLVVLSPSGDVPPELQGHATVIDWPLPDRDEIAAALDATIATLPEELRAQAAPNGNRDAAIDAAVGLTEEEAKACYSRSLVQFRRIDPATVANEKKRVIASEKVLEWFDPLPGGLDAVGGLDVLKGWLVQRKLAFSPEARAYGLPSPKGAFLVGISGCGKSLTAKAISTAWGRPLLKFDLAGAKDKYVGGSEAKIRSGIKVIETVGPCVVWIDELEKALAGATQGAADGGVSSDQLGTLLSWMQDRTGQAFIVATANDVSKLPPELLRKGRFDELFFVDLPNRSERADITIAALTERGRRDAPVDYVTVADATEGFTGAEIAALVPEALFTAFADGARQITTADLVAAASTVAPLSKTKATEVEALRAWAKGKARPATSPLAPEAQVMASRTRKIDL